jgi:hypothetical protein
MPQIRFGNRRLNVPGSQLARSVLGVLLIIGGTLGFLPVLGFWMLPLGLVLLSYDFAAVRRLRRRMEVSLLGAWKRWWNRWRKKR